jgi:hypothetical protein
LDGAGSARRGVALAASPGCEVTLTNTGEAADVFRLSITGSGQLRNALAALKSGESQQVEVFGTGTVTLRATSESAAKSVTATCRK